MRRFRIITAGLAPIVGLLMFAGPALATTYGGEGIYGSTNSAEVTNAMFFLLGLIPVMIIIFSIIQGFLDHRRHEREAAEKAARAAEPMRTGW